MVLDSAAGQWNEVERRSAVLIEDRFVPYPFQLHLGHAPESVRDSCLRTLPRVINCCNNRPAELNFKEWVEGSLGTGIADHFMIPYNEKLFAVPAHELTCEWLGRFVPRPSPDEVREGALSTRVVQTGYNRRFLYPRRGGIAVLWKVLASGVAELLTNARVTEVDTDRRMVHLASGESVQYREGVISSIPLRELASLVMPSSPALNLRKGLRATHVTCVNVGIRQIRRSFDGLQWLYLPERRFRAHRVGFYNPLAPSMSPPSREGVYVDIAHGPTASSNELVNAALDDLIELGAIVGAEDVDVVFPVRIANAYVVHDFACAPARRAIHRELAGRGVQVVGRYGNWEYAAMEDAILQGFQAASMLLSSRKQR
jgi:protoporphyrinogen oxidase